MTILYLLIAFAMFYSVFVIGVFTGATLSNRRAP